MTCATSLLSPCLDRQGRSSFCCYLCASCPSMRPHMSPLSSSPAYSSSGSFVACLACLLAEDRPGQGPTTVSLPHPHLCVCYVSSTCAFYAYSPDSSYYFLQPFYYFHWSAIPLVFQPNSWFRHLLPSSSLVWLLRSC